MCESRKRAANYTNDEKLLLINIISEFKNVVECKKSNAVTWKDKEETWNRITEKFNSAVPNMIPRSKESIKKFYDNKKKEIRKMAAFQRAQSIKTGGGVPVVSTNDQTNNILLEIVNEKTIMGLSNPFDGDNIIIENEAPETNIIQNEESAETELSNEIDWGNYKADNLKTPVSKKLRNVQPEWKNRRRPRTSTNVIYSSHLAEQYSKLATIKLELAEMQRDALKTELAIKQERDNIEFELKKRSLELDIEMKQIQLKKMLN